MYNLVTNTELEMNMSMKNTIKCKSCGEEIEISDALKHQVKEQVIADLSKKHEEQLERVKKDAEHNILKKSKEELDDLSKQLQKKDEKLEDMRGEELKLREEKRKIEEEKKDLKIEVQRKLDKERSQIEEKATKKAQDEHRHKDLENNKVIESLKKSLEEAQRKAQQGSQQLQGEVLELDFEQLLKDNFRSDSIEPVEKGVKGADVRQTVKSPKGIVCGVILWETKRTKAWSDSWVDKLKKDLRAEKANIPVIVSIKLPRDMDNEIEFRDGVWISSFKLALPLAQLLRRNLLDVGYQKALSTHRGEKTDRLYEYITSHEFRQQVEAMVEVYFQMKNQITKEKVVYEKMWRSREKQVDKLFSSTANVVGSIQGEVGQTAFQIKGLELKELDDGDKENK